MSPHAAVALTSPPEADPFELSSRVKGLHAAIQEAPLSLCAERALLVTRYFKDPAHRTKPMVIQKAEALASVLANKRVQIYPHELLVGNFTSSRVGGGLYPELHGVVMMEDLFRFETRKVNRLKLQPGDRKRLLTEVLPFWATRVLALRGRPLLAALRFVLDQTAPARFLINESGGVSHFVPDYKGLLERGTSGFRKEAVERAAQEPKGSPATDFYTAVQTACDGLERFAEGYQRKALSLAQDEKLPSRRRELETIAAACARVPREPARSFQEALQAILFAQIALNLESLDNAVSPGRLDQILFPYFEADRKAGLLDDARAFELLCCFGLKLCEIIPIFSERVTRFHGGLFNGQVVVVGGTDGKGEDVTNDLSYLFLEVMDRLRTRQPNYHARLHAKSPAAFRARAAAALAKGSASPALYNDEVIVPLVQARGVPEPDARDYATVGCVEPVPAGKSFLSTDAALVNVPLCLELAFNQGLRCNGRRAGVRTAPVESCTSMQGLFQLFRAQLAHVVAQLLEELRAIEEANARFHPTPLTSMLLEGCLARGKDASSGGTLYNGSGIQGVGVVEVGDSLAAIEEVVFKRSHCSLAELAEACRNDFAGNEALRKRLRAAPKYGSDDDAADRWVAEVMKCFAETLAGKSNTRGGDYAAGFYSVTAHAAFGEEVGALPSGRHRGEPFSSGLSPTHGADAKGPTAALLSYARLPLGVARNGVNYNLQLPPWTVSGERGATWLQALVDGGFAAGCMQLQINVLDPKILIEARDNPGRYPGLLVRVSGYSAYFDDLSPKVKQEIIDRLHPGN